MTLSAQLREACVGRPAKINWPHRLLHDAADALDSANAALSLVKEARPANPQHALTAWEIPHSTFIACGEARAAIENARVTAQDGQPSLPSA